MNVRAAPSAVMRRRPLRLLALQKPDLPLKPHRLAYQPSTVNHPASHAYFEVGWNRIERGQMVLLDLPSLSHTLPCYSLSSPCLMPRL